MNIFDSASEFIDLDNRRFRARQTTSRESLANKLLVQLPPTLIEGKSVLDLGSCLGAAGHHALTYGASSYTGVEIQQYYVDTSKTLLGKYWDNNWTIVQQDIEQFLDIAIAENRKYDYVLAAGIIYGFLDIVNIIEKISKVSSEFIVYETLTVHTKIEDNGSGIILISDQGMVKGKSADVYDYYTGIGSRIDLKALDIVMSTLEFERKEDTLLPKKINDCPDAYNDDDPWYFKFTFDAEFTGPIRYIVRYVRCKDHTKTVQSVIKDDIKLKNVQWVFDNSVAERFQHEAETNIPSYHTVIDKCLHFANKYLQKTDRIIDVGSALGYTMGKFIDAGYTNVMGVDNSPAMNEKNKYSTICSDRIPSLKYNLVLMNWTLHFLVDKESYLRDIYDNLDHGYLILTDKTSQSTIVKDWYYDFKRSKGVSDEYIKQKETSLVGVMNSVPVDWYLKTLRDIGFTVDIIHAEYGFITFLCKK